MLVEGPDRKGIIDFLSELASVEAEYITENGDRFILVTVKASEHEGASWWAEHEFKVKLPQRIEEEE